MNQMMPRGSVGGRRWKSVVVFPVRRRSAVYAIKVLCVFISEKVSFAVRPSLTQDISAIPRGTVRNNGAGEKEKGTVVKQLWTIQKQ
jgi:hypothetical protein